VARSLQTPGAEGGGLLAATRALRGADARLLGQLVRFLITGGIATGIYVASTNLLAYVAGLPFEAALIIGFGAAIATQFTLFRLWVWPNRERFALPLHHQAGRFLAVAALVYGLTAACTSLLPGALEVPTEVVYLACVAASPVVNFVVSRNGIFHSGEDAHALAPADAHEPAPAGPEGPAAVRAEEPAAVRTAENR
jgi:putative flippase GtrA